MGFVKLAARLRTGNNEVGFLADGTSHLATGGFDAVFGFIAAESWQGTCEHKGLPGQQLGGLRGGLALRPGDATGTQLLYHLAVVRLVEKSTDAGGHDRAYVAHR